jgi:hypothetical protein
MSTNTFFSYVPNEWSSYNPGYISEKDFSNKKWWGFRTNLIEDSSYVEIITEGHLNLIGRQYDWFTVKNGGNKKYDQIIVTTDIIFQDRNTSELHHYLSNTYNKEHAYFILNTENHGEDILLRLEKELWTKVIKGEE